MSRWSYSDEELDRYFQDPSSRRGNGGKPRPTRGLRGYWHRRFEDPRKAEGAFITSLLAGVLAIFTLAMFILLISIADDLPLTQQLENPEFQLASIAYTSDGRELQRYAYQNRSWVSYDEISPHIVNGLLATEDHRFYSHWGIDMFRTVSAIVQTALGDRQGGSTITQQLARNLYNEEIGKEVTVQRKLKEMVTSVRLERRYTKREIMEMYLNTVEFVYNAFGIEAAAQTFFSKSSAELEPLEAATLIGMLQNPVLYNPVRFHDRSLTRRNVILRQMVKHDYLTQEWYDEHRNEPIPLNFRSSELTAGPAPYFAEYVRNWLRVWGRENGYNIYRDGLVVYTTLDSRLQEMASAAVTEQMEGLQAVVDYEWSRRSGFSLGNSTEPYLRQTGYTPFEYFWNTRTDLVNGYIRDTDRFRSMRADGVAPEDAIRQLRQNSEFMDSLRTIRTRLEAGLVSIDPRTGYVKAWVGGRDLTYDWYDHVAIAKRQPGSTFKPFVYVAAIDNGYSPYYMLPDTAFTYRDPRTGQTWSPRNVGAVGDGYKSLAEGLATSDNIVTARVMTQLVDPAAVAFYARRMGVTSRLDKVPALALGVSDVSLFEMAAAYSTLANGGLYHEPTVITRIEDRFGNVLYESVPSPQEALSESTAYTVVDMMRGAIQYGTAQRIRFQFGLGDYDLAGKTGTTQQSADGWFMLMHPDLVTGAWVGFNDRRIQFRTIAWGQGGRNALLLVGDYMQRATQAQNSPISRTRFPTPADYGIHTEHQREASPEQRDPTPETDRRVGW